MRTKKKKKISNIKKKKGNKGFKRVLLSLIVMCFCAFLAAMTYYFINMGKVSNNNTLKDITIEQGSISSVARTLKANNLIKNITMFKVYIKLSGNSNLKAGNYSLSEDMGTEKIVNILVSGKVSKNREIDITFKEGKNVRDFARVVSETTINSYDDVINIMGDSEYIDSLIAKYWFLTDEIKNKDIYYPLEGYLYPDTFKFDNNEVSIKDIITRLLDEMDNKLSKYKDDIDNSKYSVHEIITLASIVELEVANANDRKDVAGVFINRLNSRYYPTLGSDASSYYGAKVDDWKNNPLTSSMLNDCSNKYNTRCSINVGLPVGPICNPSIESIEAVISPNQHNYYYFVNDCSGKLYMSENDTVHLNTINRLKREGKWCA